jgi:hypothetical protein
MNDLETFIFITVLQKDTQPKILINGDLFIECEFFFSYSAVLVIS